MSEGLNAPHGGVLVDLLVEAGRASERQAASSRQPVWLLTPRQMCDLELLVTGGFSPLRGFLRQRDYESVCSSMRLSDGALWPMPITLDVTEAMARQLKPGVSLGLQDSIGTLVAVLQVEDVWQPDRTAEANAVFGTDNREHPGVAYLLEKANPWYVGGRLEGLTLPGHEDFPELRRSPQQLREEFVRNGWSRVVAFQTRNPLHRAHYELTMRAAKDAGAKLLIHPVVGLTKPGDVDHLTRVKCYQALLPRYSKNMAMLSLLPLAMRMGGPREAVWHAIIRKNYGVTHFIVGRDHAGPGKDSSGRPFYGPYDAQDLLRQHERELNVTMVEFKMMVYVPELDQYVPMDAVPSGKTTLNISGTELRKMLLEKIDIPAWFTFPEVVQVLRENPNPPVG